MATIKKAQRGKTTGKEEMVPSEMFPGKMIPKSKSNYANGSYAKMLEAGKPKPAATTKIKPKAKDGKWMQKAAASIKRRGTEGKCTPITKPGCTGRAKALAKTFKKIAAKRKGK